MVVTALVTLVAVPVDAALYRWVDERGVVQFSDQPPPKHADGATISLDVQPPASGTTPLTDSISERSRSLSQGRRPVMRKSRRSRTSNAGRSTSSRSTGRSSPTVRVPSY